MASVNFTCFVKLSPASMSQGSVIRGICADASECVSSTVLVTTFLMEVNACFAASRKANLYLAPPEGSVSGT